MANFTNTGNSTLIAGTDEADVIQNSGNNVTISSGKGNDNISNTGAQVSINSGEGDDFISLTASSITAEYPDPTVMTGEGNDTIQITTNTSYNEYNGQYFGTTSLDITMPDFSTVDSIVLTNSVTGFDAYIRNGELHLSNNDKANPGLVSLIFPSVSTATKFEEMKNISVTNGTEVVTTLGSLIKNELSLTNNVTVTGTDYSDTIRIDAENNFVNGLAGDDLITVDSVGKGATISGGDGNDIIANYADNVLINADNGDDKISLVAGKNSTLNGGAGADMIFLNSATSNVTISGGDGSDTINFIYSDLDAGSVTSAVITDLTAEDALAFGKKVNSISAEYKSNSLILTDDQSFISVTLQGVTSTKDIENISVMNGNTATTLGSLLTDTVNVKSQQRVIQDMMYSFDNTSLTGTAAIDAAVVYASDGRFTSYSDLITKFVNESKNYTDATTFLKNCCGIDLSNTDTGAITGYDVGYSTAQLTAENIVPEDANSLVSLDARYSNGTLDLLTDVNLDSATGLLKITKNGLTLNVADFTSLVTDSANEDDTVVSATAASKLSVVNGLYSWWLGNSLDLIDKSFKINFQEDGATFKEMNLNFYTDTVTSAAYAYCDQAGATSGMDLNVNLSKVGTLNLETNSSGLISQTYLDRIIAHELTHAAMGANVSDFKKDNYYTWALIAEGMAELTQGADDTRNGELRLLVNKFADKTVLDIVTTVTTNTVRSGSDSSDLQKIFSDVNNVEYVFGYALLRYFAKQVSDSSTLPYGAIYSGDKQSVSLTSLFSGSAFDIGKYNTTLKTVNVSGINRALTVHGNDADNTITSLSGGGTIFGEAGNDTLYAGNGVDYFVYASGDGNDVINDFSSSDFLKITEGNIDTIFADNNGDVNVKIADGTILLKNVADMDINIIDSSGKSTKERYSASVASGGNSTPSGGNTNTSGGTSTTSGGNDTTASGENDTTSGEDDTTSGGSIPSGVNSTTPAFNGEPLPYADGFYNYTGSDKSIVNYTQGEKIKLSTDFAGITFDSNNISVQSSSGTLQISNAKGKVIDITDSNGTTFAYAYLANGAGTVDGRIYSNFEVIIGAPNNSNYVIAGDGGSSLFGGGGNGLNTLVGGAGKDNFVYNSGSDIIKNFSTGDVVNVNASISGYGVAEDEFYIYSDPGSITVKDVKNKIIEVTGSDHLKAFIAGSGGILDGRNISGKEIIVGAKNAANDIYVGASGGSLWGGSGDASDTLTGGDGVDMFWIGSNDGSDYVKNASQNDFVNLYDMGLSSVVKVEATENTIFANFTTGRTLTVNYTNNVSPIFLLSDVSQWQYTNPSGWKKLDT